MYPIVEGRTGHQLTPSKEKDRKNKNKSVLSKILSLEEYWKSRAVTLVFCKKGKNMQFILDFKNNHPILFWFVLPFLVVAGVFLFLSQSQSVEEEVKDAEKQDAESKVETQHIKDQAVEQQHIANSIQDRIDNIDSNDVSEDWHTHVKKEN